MNYPLYDRIGAGYDTTRKADPEICRRRQRDNWTERTEMESRYHKGDECQC